MLYTCSSAKKLLGDFWSDFENQCQKYGQTLSHQTERIYLKAKRMAKRSQQSFVIFVFRTWVQYCLRLRKLRISQGRASRVHMVTVSTNALKRWQTHAFGKQLCFFRDQNAKSRLSFQSKYEFICKKREVWNAIHFDFCCTPAVSLFCWRDYCRLKRKMKQKYEQLMFRGERLLARENFTNLRRKVKIVKVFREHVEWVRKRGEIFTTSRMFENWGILASGLRQRTQIAALLLANQKKSSLKIILFSWFRFVSFNVHAEIRRGNLIYIVVNDWTNAMREDLLYRSFNEIKNYLERKNSLVHQLLQRTYTQISTRYFRGWQRIMKICKDKLDLHKKTSGGTDFRLRFFAFGSWAKYTREASTGQRASFQYSLTRVSTLDLSAFHHAIRNTLYSFISWKIYYISSLGVEANVFHHLRCKNQRMLDRALMNWRHFHNSKPQSLIFSVLQLIQRRTVFSKQTLKPSVVVCLWKVMCNASKKLKYTRVQILSRFRKDSIRGKFSRWKSKTFESMLIHQSFRAVQVHSKRNILWLWNARAHNQKRLKSIKLKTIQLSSKYAVLKCIKEWNEYKKYSEQKKRQETRYFSIWQQTINQHPISKAIAKKVRDWKAVTDESRRERDVVRRVVGRMRSMRQSGALGLWRSQAEELRRGREAASKAVMRMQRAGAWRALRGWAEGCEGARRLRRVQQSFDGLMQRPLLASMLSFRALYVLSGLEKNSFFFQHILYRGLKEVINDWKDAIQFKMYSRYLCRKVLVFLRRGIMQRAFADWFGFAFYLSQTLTPLEKSRMEQHEFFGGDLYQVVYKQQQKIDRQQYALEKKDKELTLLLQRFGEIQNLVARLSEVQGSAIKQVFNVQSSQESMQQFEQFDIAPLLVHLQGFVKSKIEKLQEQIEDLDLKLTEVQSLHCQALLKPLSIMAIKFWPASHADLSEFESQSSQFLRQNLVSLISIVKDVCKCISQFEYHVIGTDAKEADSADHTQDFLGIHRLILENQYTRNELLSCIDQMKSNMKSAYRALRVDNHS